MIHYIHGSEDSIDLDVIYVFNEIPSFHECRDFCSDKKENRNIVTIQDGIVNDCFIGTIDEINNALLDTYYLHPQKYPLLVERRVVRDKELKAIRATRGILSLLSRTQYRQQVKLALRSSFSTRLKVLKEIDFSSIDFSSMQKQLDGSHILKVIAFQIGQVLGLLDGIELYTKSSISKIYPYLYPYLYREENVDVKVLNQYVSLLVDRICQCIPFTDIDDRFVRFDIFDKIMNLKNEEYIKL